jgi:hypothetical protein
VLVVTLNLLAFHTVCDQTEPLWQLARSKTSSRVRWLGSDPARATGSVGLYPGPAVVSRGLV